jgi:hypothetical protein
MRLKSVRRSNLEELNARSAAFVAACGYEHRSSAIAQLVNGPDWKVAMCFREWPEALARRDNERVFVQAGFQLEPVGGNESDRAQAIVSGVGTSVFPSGRAFAFDISSMTRAWHGAIVRGLRAAEIDHDVETFFAYVPAKFRRSSDRVRPNEFVEPVDGFAALKTPELPVAAVIGLGYEKERALGMQQFLDPERTVLLVPRAEAIDPFYTEVKKNNRGILRTTPPERVFEYSLADPAGAFSTLASIVSGLRESYRVVLVSLGPKIFGLLCFLLASRFQDVSVWRVSSGVHGKPRDAFADIKRLVVLSATWSPETR